MARRRPDCGLMFPGVGFLVCSISTRLRAQMIIDCTDQWSAIDRLERSISQRPNAPCKHQASDTTKNMDCHKSLAFSFKPITTISDKSSFTRRENFLHPISEKPHLQYALLAVVAEAITSSHICVSSIFLAYS